MDVENTGKGRSVGAYVGLWITPVLPDLGHNSACFPYFMSVRLRTPGYGSSNAMEFGRLRYNSRQVFTKTLG